MAKLLKREKKSLQTTTETIPTKVPEKVETVHNKFKQMNPVKQEEVVETAIQEDVEWVEDPRRVLLKRSSSSGLQSQVHEGRSSQLNQSSCNRHELQRLQN